MGDSGALLIGFYSAVSSIEFVNMAMEKTIQVGSSQITAPYGIISALLMIPVFDTIRVFTLRIIKSGSPFKADRNHFHHRLLDLGFSHTRASLSMALLTISFLIIALFAQPLGNTIIIIGLYSLMFIINFITFLIERKNKQQALA
jgi:UDP-N-acetylmuramyl pentapeptide phosphotransferase/UDP-N-acetylglucosamine-1-phosphate transferase